MNLILSLNAREVLSLNVNEFHETQDVVVNFKPLKRTIYYTCKECE